MPSRVFTKSPRNLCFCWLIWFNLFTQAEKHLQIRQDAEKRYMAMLERACKMLADQIIGDTNNDAENFPEKGTKTQPRTLRNPFGSYSSQSADELGTHGPEVVSPRFHQQRADCSTESCLTSHESPIGLPVDGSSPGGKKRVLNMDSTNAPLMWGDSDLRTPDLHAVQVNSRGITGYGV